MTVVVGTAGHIDHGKTTLLQALTGIDADRLPEERRRGMTIDVGYAHLTLADGRQFDFVDVPGHERLIGNMLVGVGEIDVAMLVVAADDGPRAQTLEHLALLDAMAIGHGIVVVTKTDVAGAERTAAVVADVERLIAGTTLAGSPVVTASAVTGEGLDEVRSALERLAVKMHDDRPARPGRGSRLAIDRVFAVKGRGLVVTGSLRGRSLATGASLRLVPGDLPARARQIQVHGTTVDRAQPGRTAVNVAGQGAVDVRRGMILTDDPRVLASDRWLVALSTALPDRTRARLHSGTAAVDVDVGRSGHDAIDLADGRFVAILRLTAPVATAIGDRFVLRRGSGTARIVGGVVLDDSPARGISRRRQTRERIERLALAVAANDQGATDDARLALHGALPATPGSTATLLADDVEQGVVTAVLATAADARLALTDARAAAASALRRRVSIDRTAAAHAAADLIDRMVADGRLVRDGMTVARPGTGSSPPPPDADPAVAAAMERLERALDVATPPSLEDAARIAGCPADAVRELERSGRIIVLEPDLAYAAGRYAWLAETALAMAAITPLTPAAFRDASGTSRRYVLAVLADLDRRAVLRRTEAGHVPGPRAGTARDPGPPR